MGKRLDLANLRRSVRIRRRLRRVSAGDNSKTDAGASGAAHQSQKSHHLRNGAGDALFLGGDGRTLHGANGAPCRQLAYARVPAAQVAVLFKRHARFLCEREPGGQREIRKT